MDTHFYGLMFCKFTADFILPGYFSGTGAITNTSVSHLEGDISRFQRMSSIDSFNQKSHPNEMLTGLRYFERPIKGDNGTLTKVRVVFLALTIIIPKIDNN